MQDVNIWPPFKCVNSGSPTLVELHGSPTPFWDGHHGGIQWVPVVNGGHGEKGLGEGL